jgi:hypothetical protein
LTVAGFRAAVRLVTARTVAVVKAFVVAVLELFAVFGSAAAETTETLFDNAVVGELGAVSPTDTVAELPAVIVSSAQVTIPDDSVHAPWLGVAES